MALDGTLPMADALAHHARSSPGRVALYFEGEAMTFGELDVAANAAAVALHEVGVAERDIVAIVLPNGFDHVITSFAAWKLGASPLPLSVTAPTVERDAMLELAKPAVIVGDVATQRCPVVRPQEFATADPTVQLPSTTSEQPWKVIGSGGSTGRPKLIVAGHPARVDPTVARYTIEPGDTVFVPGPLYHQGPFIFVTAGLMQGNTVIMMGKFEAAAALELMAAHRVTWAYLVPTMCHRLLRLPPSVRAAADLSAMRLLVSTGAPWPAWSKAEWIAWLGPEKILEFYGGTEEQGGLNITGLESLRHPGAIGRRTDVVRVVDPQGDELPDGEVGELVFRERPTGSHHYLGAEMAQREGWRSYGDMAFVDEAGYVHIADRRTDLIVTGGVNVYPAEVEAALEAHQAVGSAVVIGLPDEEWGQRVHAIVEVTGATHPEPQALSEHLRGLLAGPKIPRSYEVVTEPLRDDAGKVRRSRLRDERLGGITGAQH